MLSENLVALVKTIPHATVAEIGVAKGDTAFKFLLCDNVDFYYGIDPFELYEEAPSSQFEKGYLDLKMVKVPGMWGSMDNLKQICQRVLSVFEGRYKLIEKYSHEAAEDVPDPIDILYIDGNHQYEYVMQDLEIWYPKVREGGLVIGDDYHFHGGPVTEGYGGKEACEVDRACQDFCAKHGLEFEVLDGNFIIRK